MISAILATLEPAAAAEGANQLVQIAEAFGLKPHLLLAQIINFALVAWILYALVLKPIQKKLDERAGMIAEGLKKAEESEEILKKARAQAESLILDARKESKDIIAQTRQQAEGYMDQKRASAQKEASSILEAARKNLALEHEQLISNERKRLAGLVVSLAEKSLGEELSPEQRERFAAKASEKF